MAKGIITCMGLSEKEVADVYQGFGHLVLRRCRAILRNDALADDALQDVFVRLMRYGNSFREAENKVRWLYRVSDNVCFDLFRKQQAWREQPEENADNASSVTMPPAHSQHVAEDRDLALRLVRALDPEQQTIAVLYYLDGLSQAEIGVELKLSRQTINKKIDQIRAALDKQRHALGQSREEQND